MGKRLYSAVQGSSRLGRDAEEVTMMADDVTARSVADQLSASKSYCC